MSYHFVDHRAPGFLPRRADPFWTMEPIVFEGIGLALPLIALIVLASIFPGWLLLGGAVLSALLFMGWFRAARRGLVHTDDYRIKDCLEYVRDAYWRHSSLREVIEPALVALYRCAREDDYNGAYRRRDAVIKLVNDQRTHGNDADLELINQFVETRKQMRKEGLL